MSAALPSVSAGALPRALGVPSPLGTGGRRLFSEAISKAFPKPEEPPSLRGSEGRPSLSDQVRQQVDGYASVFVGQMVQAMRASTFQDGQGFPHGGRGEEVFRGWMDRTVSERLSGNLGFSKHFGRALERWAKGIEARTQETSRLA